MNQDNSKEKEKPVMTEKSNSSGSILISPQAIASVTKHHTLLSYGVIGLAPRNILEAFYHFFKKNPNYGINVNYNKSGLNINIYIIVEYGMRIKSVTDSISSSVKYNVEKTIGIPVNRVNVHVRGLRISNPD